MTIAMRRVQAVRGAGSVLPGRPVSEALGELIDALLEANSLVSRDVISWVVALTADLAGESTAGLDGTTQLAQVPAVVLQHARIAGEMPRVVRTLLHVDTPSDQALTPVYLGDAAALRPDLETRT